MNKCIGFAQKKTRCLASHVIRGRRTRTPRVRRGPPSTLDSGHRDGKTNGPDYHRHRAGRDGYGVLRRAPSPAARFLVIPVLLLPARRGHASPAEPPARSSPLVAGLRPSSRPRQDLPPLRRLRRRPRRDARGSAPAGAGDAGRAPGACLLRRAERTPRRARRVQGLLHERYVLGLLPLRQQGGYSTSRFSNPRKNSLSHA